MDAIKGLRLVAGALLLLSGLVHTATGLSLAGTDSAAFTIDVLFGVIYVIIGIGLIIGKRLFLYLGLVLPLLGGTVGTYVYVTYGTHFDLAQTSIALIFDIVVAVFCAYLLLKKNLSLSTYFALLSFFSQVNQLYFAMPCFQIKSFQSLR